MLHHLSKECLGCKNPLCIKGCPAQNNIKEIIKVLINYYPHIILSSFP